MKGATTLAILAMAAMCLLMVHQTEAIKCNDLIDMLRPCASYLRSGGTPSGACCAGAKKVHGATQSQADRRTACTCAKNAIVQFKVRLDAATSLAGKCGISTSNIHIPINPNVNCNNIH